MLKASAFLVLDQVAGWIPSGVCLVVGFWISLARMILAGIVCFRFGGRPVGGCRVTLTESLILAQDERWRRA